MSASPSGSVDVLPSKVTEEYAGVAAGLPLLTIRAVGALLAGALEDEPPTTFIQVVRAIQLLLFSQPQPLCVVTHKGYKVPYQLHCCAPLLPTELELSTIGIELLERDELTGGILEGVEDACVPAQIAPVSTGISVAPPRLST